MVRAALRCLLTVGNAYIKKSGLSIPPYLSWERSVRDWWIRKPKFKLTKFMGHDDRLMPIETVSTYQKQLTNVQQKRRETDIGIGTRFFD
ncbi:unnamed protein product [Dovyalis caffra]|uniref:Uncharacterized protein n=1 Tax=Dovyalis caffra TaxID=77055 RepID=A0AAV1R771_9ROSI|nr:unnamed protein product [Dovyalis caffra]